jgi:serpin B
MDSLSQSRKHIFLSAHLDDAVFSCGGLITKAVSLGCPVEVITFYTKQVSPQRLPPRQEKLAIYEQRKKEDVAALEVLGAVPVWCDYPERFLRPPWLASPLQVFRTPEKGTVDDFDNSASIQRYLSELMAENSEAQFFAPLGVGHHYDHVELFLASLVTAMDQGALNRLVFYEDAYALGTQMRKRHFVTKGVCWRWWEAPAASNIKWFFISTVMAAQARGRAVEEYLPERCRSLRWTMVPEQVAEFEDKKLESMSKYETQVRMLGGMGMFERLTRRYHRFFGGAEPYWVARQPPPRAEEVHVNTASDMNPDAAKLVTANNDLGFRLLSQLVDPESGKNVFLSSFSVAIALAMAYNGAEGQTKRAMAKVLGLTGLELQRVNATNVALMSMQAGLDPQVQLAIANSIWARDGIEPSPDFGRRIQEYYAGKVINLDFDDPGAADVINKWVADKTNEKIVELVTQGTVSQAILILINAVYFKGLWTTQFDEEKTEKRAFTLLDGSRNRHPMMSQSGCYDYYENELFQAVGLPYGERRVSMVVFLPKPAVSMDGFLQALSVENWQQWTSGFYEMEGDVVLPRFKVEYGANLLPNLIALGGGELAGPDFLGMGAGPLLISKVIHKTFVEVNEEGTEAAAATAVVMERGIPDRFSMIVDRPFFCALCDRETGVLLFMGFVLDPS